MLVVEEGEPTKSVAVADLLWQKLLDLGADRKTVVVAAGGGVVGDLAGFVAATFARGIPFVQVPTTLLAQVDSSVGGKTGVNLPGAKNMVGAFWQPLGVFIDVQTLKTQRERDYRSGLAEVVKYGVILDPDFFAFLEKEVAALLGRRHRVLQRVVARSCELKAEVVEADEREESGRRAVLNYGHTFCHALETVTGYGELLHGEGVAIGMMCAARLAQRLGQVDEEFVARQRGLLVALGLPVVLPDVDHEELLRATSHDKKVEHGRLRFVLPTRLGHVELVSDVDVGGRTGGSCGGLSLSSGATVALRLQERHAIWLLAVAAGTLFLIDLLSPLGFAIGHFYIPLVAAAAVLCSPMAAVLFTVLCLVLMGVEVFSSADPISMEIRELAIINRGLAMLMTATIAVVIIPVCRIRSVIRGPRTLRGGA